MLQLSSRGAVRCGFFQLKAVALQAAGSHSSPVDQHLPSHPSTGWGTVCLWPDQRQAAGSLGRSSVKGAANTSEKALTKRTLFCWYLTKRLLRYRSVAKKTLFRLGLDFLIWLKNQLQSKGPVHCTTPGQPREAQGLPPGQEHHFQGDQSTTSLPPEGPSLHAAICCRDCTSLHCQPPAL